MKTIVIFKKDVKNDNEIIAFMPYDFCDFDGSFTCYAHIGQHSKCEYAYFKECKTASSDEYKPLLAELISIGYDVIIKKRLNTEKFREAYSDFIDRQRELRTL